MGIISQLEYDSSNLPCEKLIFSYGMILKPSQTRIGMIMWGSSGTSRLDAFRNELGTVYNNIKLFEYIVNCCSYLSDPAQGKPLQTHLKLILPFIK